MIFSSEQTCVGLYCVCPRSYVADMSIGVCGSGTMRSPTQVGKVDIAVNEKIVERNCPALLVILELGP